MSWFNEFYCQQKNGKFWRPIMCPKKYAWWDLFLPRPSVWLHVFKVIGDGQAISVHRKGRMMDKEVFILLFLEPTPENKNAENKNGEAWPPCLTRSRFAVKPKHIIVSYIALDYACGSQVFSFCMIRKSLFLLSMASLSSLKPSSFLSWVHLVFSFSSSLLPSTVPCNF